MADFSPYVPLSERNLLGVKPINSSAQRSPIFTVHRTRTAVDAGIITTRGWGMVMAEFKTAIIRVVPTPTANITVQAMFWSASSGRFIPANPALQQAGVGAGVPYDYTIEVNGRVLFVYITGTIGTGVTIQVAGVEYIAEP